METQSVWICVNVRLTVFNAFFNTRFILIVYLLPFNTSFNAYYCCI